MRDETGGHASGNRSSGRPDCCRTHVGV